MRLAHAASHMILVFIPFARAITKDSWVRGLKDLQSIYPVNAIPYLCQQTQVRLGRVETSRRPPSDISRIPRMSFALAGRVYKPLAKSGRVADP